MFDLAGQRKYLNWPERKRFLEATNLHSNLREKAFLQTLFFTGCRISEALSLTAHRLDIDDGTLVVETLKQRRNGHYRSIPVPDTLLEMIKRLAEEDDRKAIYEFSRTTGYRLVKKCMSQADINGSRAMPKALRHSFAFACISRGIPITTTKKWLGHARLETTAIYLNLQGEDERQLATRLWNES